MTQIYTLCCKIDLTSATAQVPFLTAENRRDRYLLCYSNKLIQSMSCPARQATMLDRPSGTLPRRLVTHIATLDLPAETHLIEQALANSMGVSRTPIRRALAELAKAGVVYSAPRRGYSNASIATCALQAPVSAFSFSDSAASCYACWYSLC